ncbi:3' terminal RNA ribose 2'-O-methyltransferase Hen1 [Natronocella acetinitrilica]|uniref:Small RNA 2'-O-methyltransferase n=1 Tax=Natronocella acetinitrilica TaxID=414046 RepID=A0AAE3G7M7_9GAMM|nr:methyltransferase domain-containing protein [Natronocella acetinitrilica]MCP1676937.1 3' terminal RNA ribose 2'-O-methyltransferase Hen1 [Natronocella acetinitrilica]
MDDCLHDARLSFVIGGLLDSGAETVLDLGCGSGALLKRAIGRGEFARIVGVEASDEALAVARRELAGHTGMADGKLTLIHGSYLEEKQELAGFDAAVLVETIEHLDPRKLSTLERTLFVAYRPQTVIVTTPNKEYNKLYGLADHEFRDPDHRFEWTRLKFRSWAQRIARSYGYRTIFGNIGEAHPALGSPTQAVRFTRDDCDLRSQSADQEAPKS